jgi:hypothetical protein
MNAPLEHSHEPEHIAERLAQGPPASYLRDWVYGGIDGSITTFAIVAGVIGADLPARVVLILGVVNVLADGFSMAAANFSSSRTEIEEYQHKRSMEERHVDMHPDGEREEVRQIFEAKGFAGHDLDRVVDVITAERDRWIDMMMTGRDRHIRRDDGTGVFRNRFRAVALVTQKMVVRGAGNAAHRHQRRRSRLPGR